ncbi:MAG: methyltransferase [Nitrospirae bacterium]|nr:MAG: methyltransferase [Nitrospirota bacterium]
MTGETMSELPDTPAKESQPLTSEPILRIASGFLAAKQLFVANEVGLFDALSRGPATLNELATQLHLPARTLRIVADALVALGIIERRDKTYAHSAVSYAFLSGSGSDDLRPFLRFWNRLSYPNWMHYEQAIRGETPRIRTPQEWTDEESRIFSEGVEAITASTARALAESYDFHPHVRLIDVGGGTGSFLVTILERYSQLECTLFELPSVLAVAQQKLSRTPFTHKITLMPGDFLQVPLPPGHDVILMANVIHLLAPDNIRHLLRRARQAVPMGARLLLVDFWTDATHTSPTFAALMAGEFLLVSREGDVYSVEEITQWLQETGWKLNEHRPLAGPASLVVAEAC